ncbi:MAG: SH3 domain-containing protein [Clostridia bacterium]|nr:SH3 domain-containing protein [Clostridia bacterium]
MKISRKIFLILLFLLFFILNSTVTFASTISSDINSINENKYPGVKSLIQKLKNAHPSWEFQVEYTGLDFNDVIMNECQGHGKSPMNLSPANNSKYAGMWICPICKTKVYDSENWYCTSETAIKYMIDPRNSINENDVFQFLDLSYVDNSGVSTGLKSFKINNQNLEIISTRNWIKINSKNSTAVLKNADGTPATVNNISADSKLNIDGKTYKIRVNNIGNTNIINSVTILNNIENETILNKFDLLNYLKNTKNLEILTSTSGNNVLVNCVKNSASKYSYLDNDSINAILDSSNRYKVNPLYLLARITQEQGNGSSPLANGSGLNGKYVGVYNLFNINAFGNSRETVIRNGLSYASSQGWTTRALSIQGGAKIVSEKYIAKKQNTLYYQKFNVVGTEKLYSHQYMQNVLAAQSEGSTLRKTYLNMDSNLTNKYVFTIPLYENMPKTVCIRPDTTKENPKIEYPEKTVSVNTNLIVRTAPSTSASKITTLGNGARVKVIKTVDGKIDNYTWLLVACEQTGAYGYVVSNYIK